MEFDVWFEKLLALAKAQGVESVIDVDDKDSYRDYWEDGDTPEFCLEDQLACPHSMERL